MAWRTVTGEDGPELFEASGPEWRPSKTNRRSDARIKEGRRRGTAVASPIKDLRVISEVADRLTNVAPVLKDLKRP